MRVAEMGTAASGRSKLFKASSESQPSSYSAMWSRIREDSCSASQPSCKWASHVAGTSQSSSCFNDVLPARKSARRTRISCSRCVALMSERPSVRRVSSQELRLLFNQNAYWQKAQSGEFTHTIDADRVPSPPPPGHPPGTRSQMISYFDSQGNRVARVHQYLRPDGSIGGSGRPDPKMLMVNGVIYMLPRD